jgi:hypothetical protein
MRRAARLFELIQRSRRLRVVTSARSRTSQFARAIARCVSVEATHPSSSVQLMKFAQRNCSRSHRPE